MTLREQLNVAYAYLTASLTEDEEREFARVLAMSDDEYRAEQQEKQLEVDKAQQSRVLQMMGGQQ
jgi:hypothetical protein